MTKKIRTGLQSSDGLFMVPALVINFSVILIPAIATVLLSFTEWNGLGIPTFNGIHNFIELFHERNFYTAITNNIKWTIFFLLVPIMISLVIAVILLFVNRGRTALQSIFFIPNIISPVVICAIFGSMILHPRSGILGYINHLGIFSTNLVNPLTQIGQSIWTCMFIDCWHWWGFLAVIFLAAMRQVDESIIEASEIDGAGFWRKFFSIIIPSIKSNIMFMMLMTIIWSFLTFDYIWILTGGGPANSSEMLSTLSYRASFYTHEVGKGSAISLIMSLLAGIVIVFYVRMQLQEEDAV
ncbi:sugar ABC transporter permease [uncultured Sphaerochaeta sp.]|uniref:carbohydrate ABC transporter permease n=1 Tax=uncultured Sphaerochaeta sp. TaxID=886478 RepID=UPI002A0A2D29|nr:sugar ABC transporter permease [uncultured Sphaerochaeta sp.]